MRRSPRRSVHLVRRREEPRARRRRSPPPQLARAREGPRSRLEMMRTRRRKVQLLVVLPLVTSRLRPTTASSVSRAVLRRTALPS